MLIANRWIQLSYQPLSRRKLLFFSSWTASVNHIPCTNFKTKKTPKLQSLAICVKDNSFFGPRVSSGRRISHNVSRSSSDVEEIRYGDLGAMEEMDQKDPNNCCTKEQVKTKAIALLAARALSASELRKKLIAKKFPVKIINLVITDLQVRGLLNDRFYAESFSRSQWLSLSWGPRRIKRALREKGISEEDANKATCQVFEDEDSSENGPAKILGISKPTLDRLFDQASKQWLRSCDKPLETRKSSIVRWLQYRGFDWGVTNFILKKLESRDGA